MSNVEGIGPRVPGPVPNQPRQSGEARFTLEPALLSERAGTAAAALPALAASLLVLQEAAGELPQDRAARRHGRAMLAALSRLQCALLDGPGGEAALDELASRLAEMPSASDPRLAGALHAIVLRARVELARGGR